MSSNNVKVFHYGKAGIEGTPKPGTRYVYEQSPGNFIVEDWLDGDPLPVMAAGPFDNEASAREALESGPFTSRCPHCESHILIHVGDDLPAGTREITCNVCKRTSYMTVEPAR